MPCCDVCGKTTTVPEASTFKCLQGHEFLTCGKCKGSFKEKCNEVGLKIQEAYKQHEEMVCGQGKRDKRRAEKTLSKLSANAREQKKQFDRAESSGALLCPADAEDDRSMLVPFCAHLLSCLSSEKQEDADGKRDEAFASKPRLPAATKAPEQSAAPLLDDEDLILINSPETSPSAGAAANADDALARGTARMKKKQGKSKNQKQRIHLIEACQELDDSGAEDLSSSPATNRLRVALQPPANLAWTPPEPTQREIDELSDMLKIKAAEARKLLTAAGGSPEAAVTAFFTRNAVEMTSEPHDEPAKLSVAEQASFARVAALPAEAESQGTSSSSTAKADSSDASGRARKNLPPPGRPPPPLIPQGWKAQWCASENKYYYWNEKTLATQWDVPGGDLAPPERAQEQSNAAQERIQDKSQKPRTSTAAAAAAPTARLASTAARQISQALVEELSNITGCSSQQSIEYLVETGGNLEAAVRAAGSNQTVSKAGTSEARSDSPPSHTGKLGTTLEPAEHGHLCVQNWVATSNLADAAVCLSLVHGERVRVAWTDQKEDGWAYVEIVGSDVKGYCPQAILMPAPPPLKPLAVGERFRVRVSFREPQHEKGYVAVEPGDEVIVEHRVDEPVVWAYVTRAASHLLPAQRGWLPVCVLYCSMSCGPVRAG